ncbi:hypothetical protein [Myroides sp. NP-2]|nr:hypothetical protein [Myroides sp. NP-2]
MKTNAAFNREEKRVKAKEIQASTAKKQMQPMKKTKTTLVNPYRL